MSGHESIEVRMSSGQDHEHHILPFSVYYGVAGALFVFTIITVWVAQFDFGGMNVIVAMAVAAVKASLVALFFMHLKYDNKIYASFFVGSLVFLATFIAFTMFDTETRGRVYDELVAPINERAIIYDEEGVPLIPNPRADHGESDGHGNGASASHDDEAAVDSDHDDQTEPVPAEEHDDTPVSAGGH
jgi:cytochrome c oxidase subunit IV